MKYSVYKTADYIKLINIICDKYMLEEYKCDPNCPLSDIHCGDVLEIFDDNTLNVEEVLRNLQTYVNTHMNKTLKDDFFNHISGTPFENMFYIDDNLHIKSYDSIRQDCWK